MYCGDARLKTNTDGERNSFGICSCRVKHPSQREYNGKRGVPPFYGQKAAPFLPLRKKINILFINAPAHVVHR